MNHLISSTKDLKLAFLYKDKVSQLQEEMESTSRYGKLPTHIDIELLYGRLENESLFWVYKNKILDEILLKYLHHGQINNESKAIEQNEVVEKIVFLAISLYCQSTETRFLEKSKDGDARDPTEVLDSEHWLSRSLEIAYTFLPPEAPILNQILTVHDRFHGIDKQTIPEDKEVGGFFKVLRPLSKPKSTFSAKNMMGSPIMIRIQVPKITIKVEEEAKGPQSPRKIDFANKTIDLDSLTKNNQIRGLNGPKKFEFTEYSHSTIKQKPQNKIDFTENLKNIYTSRKIKSVAEHEKHDRMKINLTSLDQPNEDQNSKSTRRPHSHDREISKSEEQAAQTERKNKSFSTHKKEFPKQKRKANSLNSTGLKLDGLQMVPSFRRP